LRLPAFENKGEKTPIGKEKHQEINNYFASKALPEDIVIQPLEFNSRMVPKSVNRFRGQETDMEDIIARRLVFSVLRLYEPCKKYQVGALFAGGWAIRAYVGNRYTEDIDVILPATGDRPASGILRAAQEAGYTTARAGQGSGGDKSIDACLKDEKFPQILHIKITDKTGKLSPIDIIFDNGRENYDAFMSDAEKIEIDGEKFNIMSVKSLLMNKSPSSFDFGQYRFCDFKDRINLMKILCFYDQVVSIDGKVVSQANSRYDPVSNSVTFLDQENIRINNRVKLSFSNGRTKINFSNGQVEE